jgi:predicted outer membrane protein
MIVPPDPSAGGRVPAHPARLAALVLAAVALLGTSCAGAPPSTGGASGPTTPGVAGGRSAVPAPDSTGVGLPTDDVGRAHQAALGLIALGTLGAEKGSTDAVRALGERVTTDGRAVDERVRALADRAGIALGDDLGAAVQALLADVAVRTGQPFDQGWVRAVLDLGEQARDAANAVLSSDASDEAKSAAREVLARLDALGAAVRETATTVGAATPTAVNAGSGGRVVTTPVRPVGFGTGRPGAVVRSPARDALVPVGIELPDRGVTAPVVSTGTGLDGVVAAPDPPTTVGWWAPSALAGAATGTTVLAGHVDSRAGLGVFAVLRDVAVGERVLVRGADGDVHTYRIIGRRQVAKTALPADLFAPGGPPRLALVTCGGRFDRAARRYTDNVIVYAVPA